MKGVGLCTVASGQPVLAKEIVLSVVPGTSHEHLLQHSFRVLKDIQDIKGETTAVHRVRRHISLLVTCCISAQYCLKGDSTPLTGSRALLQNAIDIV